MSTSRLLVLLVSVCLSLPVLTMNAGAAPPTIGIAPLYHEIPNVGRGVSRLLISECSAGHLQIIGAQHVAGLLEEHGLRAGDLLAADPEIVRQLSASMDYLVAGEVVAFVLAGKDHPVSLGDELSDLGRLLGSGNDVAHVALEISLYRTADGMEAGHWLVEGVESREGTRLKALTIGWAGSVDFLSDEFRETMMGHATYKAAGQVLYRLFGEFPLEGEIIGVSGDAVVVDLDTGDGIEIGDELLVVTRSYIRNSAGEEVWNDDRPVGSVEVVEIKAGRCLCLVLDGAGMIAEGDIAVPLTARYVLPQITDKQ